jgi:hypothetical protein
MAPTPTASLLKHSLWMFNLFDKTMLREITEFLDYQANAGDRSIQLDAKVIGNMTN